MSRGVVSDFTDRGREVAEGLWTALQRTRRPIMTINIALAKAREEGRREAQGLWMFRCPGCGTEMAQDIPLARAVEEAPRE